VVVWLVSAALATFAAPPELDARVDPDDDRHGERDRDPLHERDRGHVAGEVRRVVAREGQEYHEPAETSGDRPHDCREHGVDKQVTFGHDASIECSG
jgi:hypothetical protein